MKILVLGGTGPMGQPVVEKLKHFGKVYVTSRQSLSDSEDIKYFRGDAHSIEFMNNIVLKNKYDAIIDFMKYSTADFSTRVDMLLDATDHYVFLSSGRVYADKTGILQESDDRIVDVCNDLDYLATDEYALNKARCEDILINHGRNNWSIVRPYITFNTQRLQLGVYEKENWLRRVLEGHSVILPEDMMNKTTTVTYGNDVADRLAILAVTNETKGQIYNVTGNKCFTWNELLRIYDDCILRLTGKRMKIRYVENCSGLCHVWNRYQIEYDRLYSRIFNNEKQERLCGNQYSDVLSKLYECLSECIINPIYTQSKMNWPYEGWSDKIAGEHRQIRSISGYKDKLRYLKHRII